MTENQAQPGGEIPGPADPPIAASISAEFDAGRTEDSVMNGDRAAGLASMPDRVLIERIFTQLGYLVDVLAPHGRVIRALDLVADAYGPSGPLFGRLDHLDVQIHGADQHLTDVEGQLGKVAADASATREFINANQALMDRAKSMMDPGAAIRAAMPGAGHRRRRGQPE